MPRHTLVFDVNETLLDLAPLDPVFESLLGDRALRQRWFSRMLHWSTVLTLTGDFQDFGVLAGACLDAVAAEQGKKLSDAQRGQVFSTIATLAPHPEVPDALARLREQGFSLIALTNSAQATVDAQFENAGLSGYFEHVLSVDPARCFKPHPDAYARVTDTLGCAPNELRLIAAHDWDITGAMRAGYAGAFVARHGELPNALGETPDIIGQDMADIAAQLIEKETQR